MIFGSLKELINFYCVREFPNVEHFNNLFAKVYNINIHFTYYVQPPKHYKFIQNNFPLNLNLNTNFHNTKQVSSFIFHYAQFYLQYILFSLLPILNINKTKKKENFMVHYSTIHVQKDTK